MQRNTQSTLLLLSPFLLDGNLFSHTCYWTLSIHIIHLHFKYGYHMWNYECFLYKMDINKYD